MGTLSTPQSLSLTEVWQVMQDRTRAVASFCPWGRLLGCANWNCSQPSVNTTVKCAANRMGLHTGTSAHSLFMGGMAYNSQRVSPLPPRLLQNVERLRDAFSFVFPRRLGTCWAWPFLTV